MTERSASFEVESCSVEDTERVGAAIAALLVPGDVVLLIGELGAGKTTLTKAIVEALGASGVTSPTFTLCHRYDTSPPIAHVDCYRIDDGDALEDLALDELLDDGCAAIVEWGERLGAHFRNDVLECRLSQEFADGAEQRHVAFRAAGASWSRRLMALHEGVTKALAAAERGRR